MEKGPSGEGCGTCRTPKRMMGAELTEATTCCACSRPLAMPQGLACTECRTFPICAACEGGGMKDGKGGDEGRGCGGEEGAGGGEEGSAMREKKAAAAEEAPERGSRCRCCPECGEDCIVHGPDVLCGRGPGLSEAPCAHRARVMRGFTSVIVHRLRARTERLHAWTSDPSCDMYTSGARGYVMNRLGGMTGGWTSSRECCDGTFGPEAWARSLRDLLPNVENLPDPEDLPDVPNPRGLGSAPRPGPGAQAKREKSG